MAELVGGIRVELHDDWRKSVHLGKVKQFIRPGGDHHIVSAKRLLAQFVLLEKRHAMPAFRQSGGKIPHRDIRPPVVRERILVDCDLHTEIREALEPPRLVFSLQPVEAFNVAVREHLRGISARDGAGRDVAVDYASGLYDRSFVDVCAR